MKKYFVKKEARIPFTQSGFQAVLEEQGKLQGERPEAVENLRKAREMGDLSENGYYKAARARLSFLDARLRRVERLVKLGQIVAASGTGAVEIGTRVTVDDGTSQKEFMIVGGYESDPTKRTISYISPLGKALFGKRVNDKVVFSAPSGVKSYTIVRIS